MSARLKRFLPVILRHEGGSKFTNDPVDPGGATKYGVSLKFLKSKGFAGDIDHDGDIDIDDIRALTGDQAAEIYDIDFWSPCGCEGIWDDRIALMVFDSAVNIGVRTASKMLQTAAKVARIDGIVGMQTLYAVNSFDPYILKELYAHLWLEHYELLIKRHPSLRKYRSGWINRVNDSLLTPITA